MPQTGICWFSDRKYKGVAECAKQVTVFTSKELITGALTGILIGTLTGALTGA